MRPRFVERGWSFVKCVICLCLLLFLFTFPFFFPVSFKKVGGITRRRGEGATGTPRSPVRSYLTYLMYLNNLLVLPSRKPSFHSCALLLDIFFGYLVPRGLKRGRRVLISSPSKASCAPSFSPLLRRSVPSPTVQSTSNLQLARGNLHTVPDATA